MSPDRDKPLGNVELLGIILCLDGQHQLHNSTLKSRRLKGAQELATNSAASVPGIDPKTDFWGLSCGTAPADPHSTPFYQRPLVWAAAVLAIGGAIGATFFLGGGEPSSDPTVEPVYDGPLEYRGVTYSVESSLYETRDKFDRDDIVCVDVAIENNSHAPITVWNHEIAIIGPDGSHRNWDTFGTDTSLPSRDELKVGDSLAGALCFTPKTGTPQQSDYQLQFVPYTSQPLAIWTLPL